MKKIKHFMVILKKINLSIVRGLNWEKKGIKINGSYLSQLRFTDDVVVIAKSPEELQEMIQEFNEGSLKVGMKMNIM